MQGEEKEKYHCTEVDKRTDQRINLFCRDHSGNEIRQNRNDTNVHPVENCQYINRVTGLEIQENATDIDEEEKEYCNINGVRESFEQQQPGTNKHQQKIGHK